MNYKINMFSYNDDIFADVNVWIDDGGVDNGAFADEDVVTDLKGKERNTETKKNPDRDKDRKEIFC